MSIVPVLHRCRQLCNRTLLSLLLVVCCALLTPGKARAQEVNEEQIKAVFLYNLTHFVTWPEDVIEQNPTFDVGVFGDYIFRLILQDTVRKEKIAGKPFVIGSLTGPEDITAKCRVLFISGEAAGDWQEIRRRVEGLPILTVSDQARFTGDGGMVSLVRQGKKIQIVVNYKRVQQAGLQMSAKLLRLARIVE